MLRGLLLHSEKIDSVIQSRPASRRHGCSVKNKFDRLSSGNGVGSSMEITAALFRRRDQPFLQIGRGRALLSRFPSHDSGSEPTSGLQRRVILRHIVSFRARIRSPRSISRALSVSVPLFPSRGRIDANRRGIDSRPSVKLIPLPAVPSGSTTSRKISWEPKGASLLLCSLGPWPYSPLPLAPGAGGEAATCFIVLLLHLSSRGGTVSPLLAPLFAFPKAVPARTPTVRLRVDKTCPSANEWRLHRVAFALECHFMSDKFRRKTAKYLPCPSAPLCVFIFLSSRDRRERDEGRSRDTPAARRCESYSETSARVAEIACQIHRA